MNAPADPDALRSRQQAAWSSGDCAVSGTARCPDLAAGNGNAA